ncbi:bile acid:sodium symporter family protein [Algivirga pacifica]|uniref:Bile acid:sodium symporter family protein n=1 Tax=Algivirga pacifica TaxID=1162670 RepID=A0ABP9DH62_9BACT
MLESLKALDTLRINFSNDGVFLVNTILAFIMFGVALEIKPNHFKTLIKNPKAMITGIASQFLLLPFITFLLIMAFNSYITPSIALGMLLVASCPGGNVSNFMTNLAKGNTALSVGLTSVASIGAIALTPLNFAFWGELYNGFISSQTSDLIRPLSIDVVQVFKTIILILGIPLFAGLLISDRLPKLTEKIIKPIKTASVVIFLAIVVIGFSKNIDLFLNHIHYVFIIVLIHNAVSLLTGYGVSRYMGLETKDRRTVTIETGIQNSGLGLALLFNPAVFPDYLPIGGMMFITGWWGIWHIISGLTVAGLWSKLSPIKEKVAA